MAEKVFAWSPCSGWLCLASPVMDSVQINFFTHKGVRVEDVIVQRKHSVSALAWHPLQILVITAWTDGLLTVLSPEENTEFNIEELKNKAKFLHWSGDGRTLFVVLDDGKCYVYTFAGRNSVKKRAEYNIEGNPTAACLKVNNYRLERQSGNDDDHISPTSRKQLSTDEVITVQTASADDSTLVVGTEGGVLHTVDHSGRGTRLCKLECRIEFVAIYHEKSLLIVMTSDMMLFHFIVMPDFTCHEKLKVKLNGKPGSSVIHLRDNILLISHQERDLRVWDFESEENGTISLQPSKGYDAEEVILCVDYCKRREIISAGTTKGKVANWKRRVGELSMENTWRLQNGNQVGGEITSLEWSPIYSALAVYSDNQLTILQDENIIACLRNKVAAIQNGSTSFTLVHVETAVNQELKLDFQVKGICLQEKQLVVWSVDTVGEFNN